MGKANQRQGRRETEKGRDAHRQVLRAWVRRIRGKDEEKQNKKEMHKGKCYEEKQNNQEMRIGK